LPAWDPAELPPGGFASLNSASMRPNGSTKSGPTVTPEQKQGRLVFARMSRYIGRVARGAKSDDVHRFRTNSRRIEALVAELVPENGNKKKLLKLLSKLRKRAGRVRDLDVQLIFLKNLRVPDRQNHRAQLLELLAEEHGRRSKKLAKSFDPETVKELRRRLRRAKSEINLTGVDPLKLALTRLPKPSPAPMTEKMLHACRIAAKHARYLAELATGSTKAKAFVEELKRAQDEVGEWHDVLKLQQRAANLFGTVHDSALVAALQNISRARFRHAVNAMTAAIKSLAAPQSVASSSSALSAASSLASRPKAAPSQPDPTIAA
jgi:CHAD domain-containing protein